MKQKKLGKGRPFQPPTILIVITAILICLVAAYLFLHEVSSPPGPQTVCFDQNDYMHIDTSSRAFKDCIMMNAQLFEKKDFEWAKDLGKSFLTLLSALLVASITFYEKIVKIESATKTSRRLMISCWLFLLAAIITCGVAMTLMTAAAGYANYAPFYDFRSFETRAVYLFFTSGLSFGGGLVSLLIAGIVSIKERSAATG